MLNIVIWGNREQYDLFINQIKAEEEKGNICVVGIVAEDFVCVGGEYDGYKVIDKEELCVGKIDCVLVTSVQFHYHIAKEEILSINPDVEVINARVLNIPLFDFKRYWLLLEKKISIIANNCWGGLTYNSLYLEFLSPFINLTISSIDYLKLLENFRQYMKEPLEMVRDRNAEGNPIGHIGDVEINFVHYRNFEEAKLCWDKRKKRINYDNLFIYMPIVNEDIAYKFSELSIERKYGFCTFPVNRKGIYYVKNFDISKEVKRCFGESRFESYMNDQARRKLYDYDDPLGNRGAKTVKAYDVLKLLTGESNFFRT